MKRAFKVKEKSFSIILKAKAFISQKLSQNLENDFADDYVLTNDMLFPYEIFV